MSLLQWCLLLGATYLVHVTACYRGKNTFLLSLVNYLHVHEIVFLKREPNEFHYHTRVKKFLTGKGRLLYATVLSYPNFITVASRGFENGFNPLVVIDVDEDNFQVPDLIKISKSVNISPFKWIVIVGKYDVEDFKGLNIPFNCEFIVAEGTESVGYKLYEVYDTASIPKLVTNLGVWTPKSGLEASKLSFSMRRNWDLQGTILNVSITSLDPCTTYDFEMAPVSVVKCAYFEMLMNIAKMRNFSINWTMLDPNTEPTDALVSNVEFSHLEISLANYDKEGLSFMWPSVTTRLRIITGYTGFSMNWSTFISPFSKNMWVTLCGWFFLSSAALAFVESARTRGNIRKVGLLSCVKQWVSFFLITFSAYCSQGYHNEPRLLSQRILFFFMFLIPTVLLPSYSASLTSLVAIKVPKAPFSDLEGLTKSKGYRLGHLPKFDISLFIDTNSSETTQALFNGILLPDNDMPGNDIAAMSRLCKEKFSWICTEYTIIVLKPKCPFFVLQRPLLSVFTTMPIATTSPYRKVMDNSVRYLSDTCITKMDLKKIMPPNYRSPGLDLDSSEKLHRSISKFSSANREDFEPILLENVISLFVVLGGGFLTSVVLFIFEIFLQKRTTFQQIMLPPQTATINIHFT